jgi:hypothetical protein
MFTIPLLYAARHMFIDTPEGRWLVDTGAPTTFGKGGTITWRGTRRAIGDRFGPVDIGQIQVHIEMPIEGLVGADLLSEEDSCWDGPAGEFRIGPAEIPASADCVPFESLLGTPVVSAQIGGRTARCIFDTGAQFGFLLDRDLAEGAPSDGTIDDFSPIIGAIRSDAWRVGVALGSVRFEERCGLLTGMGASALAMFGVDAIIGCSWLPNRTVWYRPHAGQLGISPLA